MDCRCTTANAFEGSEAASYAANHLLLVSVDNETWDAIYRCPDTDLEWTESHPASEQHGGGPSILMKRVEPT